MSAPCVLSSMLALPSFVPRAPTVLSSARTVPQDRFAPNEGRPIGTTRGASQILGAAGALGVVARLGLGASRRLGAARRRGDRKVKRRFFNLGFDSPSGPDNAVGLFYDPRMAEHRCLENSDHPEQPKRVVTVFERLEREGLAQRCQRFDAREATREELEMKHTAEHVDAMLNVRDMTDEEAIQRSEDYEDIYLCPQSTEAGLLSAGCVLEATERVCAGEVQSAICVVRPPGHHAERDCAKGFCMFGNVALAAAKARQEGWSKKTLVVDFDVHHGNGTQNMFDDDDSVLFCSLHRYDRGKYYPGGPLGNYTSHGVGKGVGYSVNVPWDVASSSTAPGDAEALYAFERVFLPIAKEFSPDLVVVSAGFDAAPGDPLGGCRITPSGFYDLTKKLMEFADGKLVLALEGGYNLESNSESMAACARALLGDSAPEGGSVPGFNVVDQRDSQGPAMSHVATVEAARKHHSKMWESLRPKGL